MVSGLTSSVAITGSHLFIIVRWFVVIFSFGSDLFFLLVPDPFITGFFVRTVFVVVFAQGFGFRTVYFFVFLPVFTFAHTISYVWIFLSLDLLSAPDFSPA